MVNNRFCFASAKLRHLKMLNLVFGEMRGIWRNKFEFGVRNEVLFNFYHKGAT